jgi:hypothetical protein
MADLNYDEGTFYIGCEVVVLTIMKKFASKKCPLKYREGATDIGV